MDTYRNYSHLNMANQQRGRKSLSPTDNSFLSLLLFWILPFIVINVILFFALTSTPDLEITIDDPGNYQNATITVKVKSIFPNDGLGVTLDDVPIEMTEGPDRTYTATVNSNGTVAAGMTNKNGMSKLVYETIDCIDDAPPTIQEADSASGMVSIYVDDAQSGVNYDSIYAVKSDGSTTGASLIDEGESLVVFNYDAPLVEVHVSDNAGHEAVVSFGTGEIADSEAITEGDITEEAAE